MSVEYAIVCDACSAHMDASLRSAAEARAALKGDGARVGLPGGRDLCRYCVAEGREPS